MSAPAEFVEYPGTRERNPGSGNDCCDSEARGWYCTQATGHDMPHQAGAGIKSGVVYAEWVDGVTR